MPRNNGPTFGVQFSFAALDIHPHRRYDANKSAAGQIRCRPVITLLYSHPNGVYTELGIDPGADSEYAGIAQAMQLFGFCERSFNGFLAPGVDPFPFGCLRKRIRLLQCILPYMVLHLPSAGMGREAFRPFGAVPACPGIAPVFPIPFPVGCAPCQLVPLRTQVNVLDWVKGETIFPEIVPLVRTPPVAYYRRYPGLHQLVTH